MFHRQLQQIRKVVHAGGAASAGAQGAAGQAAVLRRLPNKRFRNANDEHVFVTQVQAALLARGRRVRQAKLQFFAKMAEKGLSCYERDGWGEFATTINPDRREVGFENDTPRTHLDLHLGSQSNIIQISSTI